MKSLNPIKTKLIDRILATNNQKLLKAIENVFDASQKNANEIYELTSEQIEMLVMGEEDIKFGRVISQSELDERD